MIPNQFKKYEELLSHNDLFIVSGKFDHEATTSTNYKSMRH